MSEPPVPPEQLHSPLFGALLKLVDQALAQELVASGTGLTPDQRDRIRRRVTNWLVFGNPDGPYGGLRARTESLRRIMAEPLAHPDNPRLSEVFSGEISGTELRPRGPSAERVDTPALRKAFKGQIPDVPGGYGS
jgi:hypothetical protein